MFKRKYLVAAALAGILLLIPGTWSMASQFLSIFRVDQVQVVNLDRNSMEEFADSMAKEGLNDLGKMIEIDSPTPAAAENIAVEQAAEKAGFEPVLPDKLGGNALDSLILQPAGTTNIRLQVQEINSYLGKMGSSKLLPAGVDGAEIAITKPKDLTAKYGDYTLVETTSPEIAVSGGMDINQLRDVLLAIPALPADIRNALSTVDNWERTLIIPNIDGTSIEVQVNGQQGVFISSPENNNAKAISALLWPQGDIWIAVCGNLTMEEAISLAQSLR